MLESRSVQLRGPGRHWRPVELVLMLLLVVGFSLGPLKLLGTSWLSYLSADGLAIVVLVMTFGKRVLVRRPVFASSPLSVPLLLLGVYCILQLGNPVSPFIRSVLGLRSWLLYLGFFFVGLYTLRSVRQIEQLYVVLLTLGLITGAYGVYQWQVGPQSFASWSDYYGRYAKLAWSAESGAVFRAFSTFVAAGTFGGNMALLMLLAFGVAASPRVTPRWRILAAVTFSVMGAGIAASGSRGPVAHLLLSAALALILIPGVWPRVGVAFKGAILGGVATLLVAFLIGPAISERFYTILDPQTFFWKWFGPLSYGIQVAQQHPLGMGLGYSAGVPQFIGSRVFQDLPTTNIDSGYGSAAAELGLIGLVLFTYFSFKVGVEGLRAWNRLPVGRLRDLLLGPALIAGTYPIVSVIIQPQATLPSSIYSWLLVGILMRAPTLETESDESDAHRLLRSQVHS
jgi:putative inorganic carbon (HCO3(-)) transporter